MMFTFLFHQLGPLGRVGLLVAKSLCVFVPVPCNFFCVGGLMRSVPRPWTGVDRASPSHGALKTGRCSELDATPPHSKKCRELICNERYGYILPPSHHGLPLKVCWRWNKNPPSMALLFVRPYNRPNNALVKLYLLGQSKYKNTSCLCRYMQVDKVLHLFCVRFCIYWRFLKTLCVFNE